MQKKLIALALASLAGTAFAQSNVTIYGVADATYDYAGARKSSAATAVSMDNRVSTNSSYLGFKGVEDLGNGLKAVFQFEGGMSFDGAAAWGGSNRDSFVGLSSGFGTVVAGNLTAAGRALGAKIDVNSGATGVGYQGALLGRIGAVATGVDDRTANSIAYVSPNFSGFSALVAWGMGSENKDLAPRTDNVYSLGLNYENGPFYVGYAYTEVDGKSLGGADTKAMSNRVGGYFKFGTAQVGAAWDRTDADTKTGGLAGAKRDVWLLNGKFGIGAGNIIAGYARANNVDGVSDTAGQHYFVGYEHALSKRTIRKAVYAEVKNDSGVAYNFYNGSTGAIVGTVAGQDPRALQVGVRHSF